MAEQMIRNLKTATRADAALAGGHVAAIARLRTCEEAPTPPSLGCIPSAKRRRNGRRNGRCPSDGRGEDGVRGSDAR